MSTATLTAPLAPCRNCGSTERRIVDRVFKDGSEHNAEVCAQCNQHFRFVQRQRPSSQPLTIAASSAPTTSAPTMPPQDETLNRARALLAQVSERATALQAMTPSEGAQALALASCALAACANLTDENLASLATTIRIGKLRRRAS
jgi:hypothetical protein